MSIRNWKPALNRFMIEFGDQPGDYKEPMGLDGYTELFAGSLFEPLDFLTRLFALVPRPKSESDAFPRVFAAAARPGPDLPRQPTTSAPREHKTRGRVRTCRPSGYESLRSSAQEGAFVLPVLPKVTNTPANNEVSQCSTRSSITASI